ncbi:MAG: HlyD family efflux transporter periplasmic adaptor subunit [Halieaceae bacterium]|nr:HlyD family efflux transporter periplasmic adaptor subunit [Halieaceae bacterium]
MPNNKRSRFWLMLSVVIVLLLGLGYAFWPRAVLVDTGLVQRGPMRVTIDEEAKTRVRDAYVVSAPVAGRLLRVSVEPGDTVQQGQSTIARMLPVNPPALDIRSREEGKALVSSAEASLWMAQAELDKSLADRDLAAEALRRARSLRSEGLLSQASLDEAQRNYSAADAALRGARSAISQREAELATARARLISFSNSLVAGADEATGDAAQTIPINAPVTGQVLRVMQESETIVPAGTPLIEVGDITNDLEILVELLSTDAVRVSPGDRVSIVKWGGEEEINGVVERVEPWGFTKYSALGVEEQRVNALIQFTDPVERRAGLGHGYRVEVRIVVWETGDALIVPSSALFREADSWSVFVVEGGRVRRVPVEAGHNNGLQAEILEGLVEGQQVVLYPAPSLEDGRRVARRSVR